VIEQVILAILVLFLAPAGLVLRRGGPVSHWFAGWVAAGLGGVLPLLAPAGGTLALSGHLLGPLFPALLLSGTLLLARRPVPPWWLPAALGFGLVRALVAHAGQPTAAFALGLACEPLAVVFAAAVARDAAHGDGPATQLAERLLAPALLALAAMGALHLLWLATGRSPVSLLPLWLVIALPALGVQIQAAADRLRREIRAQLEERVAERTAELAASEERHRAISTLASDFAFKLRIDRQGRLQREWVAGAFEQALGVPPESIDGHGWLRLLDAEGRAEALADYRTILAGEPIALERRIVRPSGEPRWIHLRLAMLRTDAAAGIEVLGSARDVTEWKRAEAERERLARHMEQVQRLESLGILAGGIAHDFNNVLTVIRGNARLALGDLSGDAPVRARLLRIADAAEHAASLTDQMLAYAGKASAALDPLDLSALVRSTADLLRASVSAGATIALELAEDLPAVEGDATGLRQVLLNLVLNGSEAQGERGGRIVVRTACETLKRDDLDGAFGASLAPGPAVVLEVHDEGCGMDPETAGRIFEPFFTTKFSGRGLGLAAVLGIVQAHGGAIRVASAPGQGTSLRVLLPPSVRPAAPAPAAPGDLAGAIRGTVLVVDDDEGVRELAREVLERAGFRVRTVGDGRAALELVRAAPAAIDAVLLDLAMPDMSGEEAFLRLRELRGDLPVVLVTGYDAARAADHFAARGLQGFLRKPWEPEALVEAVQQAAHPPAEPS
jgi:PAS domain S-box-containing protein